MEPEFYKFSNYYPNTVLSNWEGSIYVLVVTTVVVEVDVSGYAKLSKLTSLKGLSGFVGLLKASKFN